jgi:hypothetical protein
MSDGSNVWCYRNGTRNPEFCGFVYDNARGVVYANHYDQDGPSGEYIHVLDGSTGVILGSLTAVNLSQSVGIDIDPSGGVYLVGQHGNYAEAVVEKLDSSGSLQWRTVISGTGTAANDNFAYTFSARNLIYDASNNVVLVAGDTCRLCAFANASLNHWVATLDGSSGAQGSYYEPSVTAYTNHEFTTFTGIDPVQRTAYYAYTLFNRTSHRGTWTINEFCYCVRRKTGGRLGLDH